ncbi:ESCRT-II subunit protein VPS36 NDAI_0J02640 [Naumovozyma dairenensis CBS 421]|uniref:Vacuolar protein-sorting-associated protein 36 n=1 Tax=Naumovozyma dairenensis (strain ATCC 10597 / BCRC 20456 / CBS 421 / NBRC 0211 / NRRL Y-12639) TaxID=1071378 RepID=G0WH78_NAUDC|nr:hypothetical protein NDAI_0J02640 [Naumovozyma dairenensis CBS 421]CCD27156.1 hypothetical protein NDAI_0J02640 [Naumovozyma dairenensis CBS 421]
MQCWKFMTTTSSGQPILRENEKDILMDQSVGLYHGKLKITNRQSGRIYLTSQRIIYIDDLSPTKLSLSLELDDIKKIDYSSSFLRRSAKMIIFITKNNNNNDNTAQDDTMTNLEEITSTTWVCPFCMVTNESIYKDLSSEIPTCENCGITPDFQMIKSSINISSQVFNTKENSKKNENVCPACTFINHPQIGICEICGTRLSNSSKIRLKANKKFKSLEDSRLQLKLEKHSNSDEDINKNTEALNVEFVQLSFRKSDGLLFFEASEKALRNFKINNIDTTNSNDNKRKQIFNQNLASINGIKVKGDNDIDNELPFLETNLKKIGITSLEKSRENQLLNNNILFNNALSDLNSLMNLATKIERLYRNKNISENNQKSLPAIPSLIIDRDKFYNKDLFLDEIAREIYDFAISEFTTSRNPSSKNSSKSKHIIITLVDLYAMYNKSMRIGIGLISPLEMKEACQRFGKLGLNELKLTTINKRVLCLSTSNSFDYLKEEILRILTDNPGCDLLGLTNLINNNTNSVNNTNTSTDTTANAWTMGVITETLQNCVNEGDLLIDEQISGIHYYGNIYWKI